MIQMARSIHLSKKLRLAKLGRKTRWAPFWTVPKIYGKGRRVHPGRHTAVKRSWRRTKTKA
ncbi:50S ribosomal protein L39e [Candidatus Woesearchaeota archaeon CG10_big_fil_rev_8_21_14_0_10_34_8]|nr:MAG: 50S ribosomal protein L39e [Candidatus Woesearchaeota archaeon CG10_big_fil_rev_8_21_14_0_10_34_8]